MMKSFFYGFFLGVLIGIALGMAWRIEQEKVFIPQMEKEWRETNQFYQKQLKECKDLMGSKLFGRK